MVGFGLRRHVLDVENAALLIEKGHRQRQIRIAHPHAMAIRPGEYEQHALVGRHALTMHQTLHAIGLIGSDFSFDAIKTGGQLHAWHLRLCLH